MWHALSTALAMLQARHNSSRYSYVYLITDGAPAAIMNDAVESSHKAHRF